MAQPDLLLNRVNALDLSPVVSILKHERHWNKERIQKAEESYRRLMYLFIKNPDEELVPWDLGDQTEFWRTHASLDRKYSRDCLILFGRILPITDSLPAEIQGEIVERTRERFLDEFIGKSKTLRTTKFKGLRKRKKKRSPLLSAVFILLWFMAGFGLLGLISFPRWWGFDNGNFEGYDDDYGWSWDGSAFYNPNPFDDYDYDNDGDDGDGDGDWGDSDGDGDGDGGGDGGGD